MAALSDLATFVDHAHYVRINDDVHVAIIWYGTDTSVHYFIGSDVGWEPFRTEILPAGSTPDQIRQWIDGDIDYPPAPDF